MTELEDILRAVYTRDASLLRELSPQQLALVDADGRTALMHAILAEDADPAIVKLLIERGADVNASDSAERWTALHFAARDNNAAIVRLLLDAGATVDAQDVWGNTPLWRNVMDASSGTVVPVLLMERGADPGRANRRGISPADLALRTGRTDIAEIFDPQGAGRA